MSELQFQIKGLTKNELQRDRQRQQHGSRPIRRFVNRLSRGWRVLAWTAIAICSLYALQWVNRTANQSITQTDAPAVAIGNATIFYGRNVIVLQDVSGSMQNTGARLNALLTQLSQAGIRVDNPTLTYGPGFGVAGTAENSLHKLEQALSANPTADAIFVFSDFTNMDAIWDANDPAGYEQLRELFADGDRRLYLGTVNLQPPDELLKIAYDSGGGVIEAKVPPAS